MNKRMIQAIFRAIGPLCVGALLFPPEPALAALSGLEIMTKNENARKIKNLSSTAELLTGGGGSVERRKEFTWWRKLLGDGVHFNTLTRFHSPAEIRGEGILFLENEKNENDIMMYLPNFKKTRRVESQQQSGSFMGSEFSYSDIASSHVADYAYKVLREESCGDETAPSLKCTVVEAVPASESVRERTGYSKTVSWIRPDNFMMAKGEFYDLKGALFKKISASEIQEVDPVQHKFLALKVKIENIKNGKFTVLHFKKVDTKDAISESTFSQQNLAKEK